MADPNEVYPTGLISTEAEELHDYVISGNSVAIALIAHVLA
ncbi:MAG: light-harvesting protein [Rhodomicrobium sp.]